MTELLSEDSRRPVVSYVIPAWQASAYLRDMLDCCLKQDYRPLEIVVVDDGSTDGTAGVAEAFARQHSNNTFRVLCHSQQNQGVSEARNRGAVLSTGKLIGFLDADDLIPRDRTRILVDTWLTTGTRFVFGTVVSVALGREAEVKPHSADTETWVEPRPGERYERGKFYPLAYSFLMERSLWDEVGGFKSGLDIIEDFEFIIRVRCRLEELGRTNRCVYIYRRVPESVTRRPSTLRKIQQKFEAEQLIHESLAPWWTGETRARRTACRRLWKICTDAMHFGDMALAKQALRCWLAVDPDGLSGQRTLISFFSTPLGLRCLRSAVGVYDRVWRQSVSR